MRILVVEDEQKVADALREGLEAEKYEVVVERTGEAAFFRVNTETFDAVLLDPRNPEAIVHQQVDLLRQRIYGIAAGYEDLNDHDTLRHDLVWQSAVERDQALASSPTLCRLEARANRATALAMHRVLIERFIASHAQAPTELILDFDATDDRVHGLQEGRYYHGYYGDWCFLPI